MYLRDGKENTSTTAESTEKVRSDGQSANASTTESGSSGDDTLELPVHALFTVTSHDETLVLELLSDITRGRARDLDPGLGEQGTGNKHESDVDSCVDRVKKSLAEV
jgi:hypothetical protein